MKLLISTAAVLILSGCASSNDYRIVFDSEPRGALVTCYSSTIGYTPTEIRIPKERVQGGFGMDDCKATWVSGASTNYRYVLASDVEKLPNGLMQTAKRGNEPNYAMDAQAAQNSHYQRQAIEQQQLQRQQQEMDSMQQTLQNINRPTSTNCYKAGSQVICNSY